jgi:hypothetical protein
MVQITQELLERAQAGGVSLAGPGGLLAGVTKSVLQACAGRGNDRAPSCLPRHDSPGPGSSGSKTVSPWREAGQGRRDAAAAPWIGQRSPPPLCLTT